MDKIGEQDVGIAETLRRYFAGMMQRRTVSNEWITYAKAAGDEDDDDTEDLDKALKKARELFEQAQKRDGGLAKKKGDRDAARKKHAKDEEPPSKGSAKNPLSNAFADLLAAWRDVQGAAGMRNQDNDGH